MIEFTLNKAYETQLWLGETNKTYKVSLGTSSIDKKEYLEKGYNEIIVNIDGINIVLVAHSKIRQGTISSFIYFREQEGTRYNLYLPVDEVLNNVPLYTMSKLDRRFLKIKQLRENYVI